MALRLNKIQCPALCYLGVTADKLRSKYASPWYYADDPDFGRQVRRWYDDNREKFRDNVWYLTEKARGQLLDFDGAVACRLLRHVAGVLEPEEGICSAGTFIEKSDRMMMYTLWVHGEEEARLHGRDISVLGVVVGLIGKTPVNLSYQVDFRCADGEGCRARSFVSDFSRDPDDERYREYKEKTESEMVVTAYQVICTYISHMLGDMDAEEMPTGSRLFADGSPAPVENFTGHTVRCVRSMSRTDDVSSERLCHLADRLSARISARRDSNSNTDMKENENMRDAAADTGVIPSDGDGGEALGNLDYESSSVRLDDGTDVPTFRTDVADCNILEVEVGTTGPRGGDTAHGCRTYLRIEDGACSDITVRAIENSGHGGVEIVLGGDTELDTFRRSLKYAYEVLSDRCPMPVMSGKAVKYRTGGGSAGDLYGEEAYERSVASIGKVFRPYSPEDANYKVLYRECAYPEMDEIDQPKFIGRASVMYSSNGTLDYAPVYAVVLGNGYRYFLSNRLEALQQFRYRI